MNFTKTFPNFYEIVSNNCYNCNYAYKPLHELVKMLTYEAALIDNTITIIRIGLLGGHPTECFVKCLSAMHINQFVCASLSKFERINDVKTK